MEDVCSARTCKTPAHDLPDDCLLQIFDRLGDPPSPNLNTTTSKPIFKTPASTTTTTHPLHCALVCQRWRTVASAAVRSLSLDLARTPPLLSLRQAEAMGRRFCNLHTLTLTKTDSMSERDFLAGLEPLPPPQLQALELLFKIRPPTSASSLHLLSKCQKLVALTLSLEDVDPTPWLDVMHELPLLMTLTLGYYDSGAHFGNLVWERLGSITRLETLRLVSEGIPPHPGMSPTSSCSQRLPAILRSLDWSLLRCGASFLGQDLERFTALQALTLRDSLSIRSLPESLGTLTRLTALELSCMDELRALPGAALGQLTNLESLRVIDCLNFETLPETVGRLRRLHALTVDRCRGELPGSLGDLANLESLHIRGSGISTSLGRLSRSLRSLKLVSCMGLRELPESLGDLSALEALEIRDCRVEVFPESVSRLARLKTCILDLPQGRELPGGIGQWVALEVLWARCPNVGALPGGLCDLRSLRDLRLSRCSRLRDLPGDIGRLGKLELLSVYCCERLRELPGSVRELRGLRALVVSGCRRLRRLPEGVESLPRLEALCCPLSLRPLGANPRLFCAVSDLRDADPFCV